MGHLDDLRGRGNDGDGVFCLPGALAKVGLVSMTEELSSSAPIEQLLHPPILWTRSQVLQSPCPVPATPGVYAWYFDDIPPGVPVEGSHQWASRFLLYVGISPREAPRNGRAESRQSIRTRLRYHYNGNAEGSTLRLTLGCLLSEVLGIELRRVGSGQRMTFSAGEAALSEWMGKHATVCWVTTEEPWKLEAQLIQHLALPLNIDQNLTGQFRDSLSQLRRQHRAQARALPVVPR